MDSKSCLMISRRRFLKLAALVPFLGTTAVFAKPYMIRSTDLQSLQTKVPHINPGYRIRNVSETVIDLCTQLGDGRRLAHRVNGLEADLLKEIAGDRPLAEVVDAVCRPSRLSHETCLKRIMAAIDVFEKRRWIYYGEKMAVKRVEIHRVR